MSTGYGRYGYFVNEVKLQTEGDGTTPFLRELVEFRDYFNGKKQSMHLYVYYKGKLAQQIYNWAQNDKRTVDGVETLTKGKGMGLFHIGKEAEMPSSGAGGTQQAVRTLYGFAVRFTPELVLNNHFTIAQKPSFYESETFKSMEAFGFLKQGFSVREDDAERDLPLRLRVTNPYLVDFLKNQIEKHEPKEGKEKGVGLQLDVLGTLYPDNYTKGDGTVVNQMKLHAYAVGLPSDYVYYRVPKKGAEQAGVPNIPAAPVAPIAETPPPLPLDLPTAEDDPFAMPPNFKAASGN